MITIKRAAAEEEQVPKDLLVVTDDDGKADIAPVIEINPERILAFSKNGAEYAVPLGDVKAFTGPKGRIFLYPSTIENVTDCQRIAALERSTVLKQITHFEKDLGDAPRLPLGKLLIIGAIVLVFIIIIMAVK